MKLRKDIAQNRKWDIEQLYATDDDWEKDYKLVSEKLDFSAYEGKLDSDDVLLDFLLKTDEVSLTLGLLDVYAMMRKDEDSSNSHYVSLNYRIENLCSEFSSAVSFSTPEITEFSKEKLEKLISDERFKNYSRFFEGILKQKEHVLSKESEKILAMGGNVYRSFRNIFGMADNVDFPFPEIEVNGEKVTVTHSTYSVLLQDPDRSVREKAFKAYYGGYAKLLNIISATYIASVNKDVFLAKVRKYPSALGRALQGEEVSETVYKKLLSSVNANLPVLHDYVAKRKSELGLNEMHMFDMYVPLVKDVKFEYDYDQAYSLVVDSLSVMGDEYVGLLKRAYEERWLDVYENYGKRSGAYSVGVYGMKHPYVLLNHEKTLHSVFTIAHEMGHSIHTYFSNANQPQAKADYTIFVAEVASTVNEVILLKRLLESQSDKGIKRYLLNYFLEMFRTTLFRQTMFAEFEYESHSAVERGEAISKESLNDIYLELNKKYYGESVVSDGEIAFEWARIPHFYSAFYVYKYATGIISAVTIADKILSGEKGARENYFAFLSSGCSDTPVNLLKIAGVDLETEVPYEKAMQMFKQTLLEYKKLGE